MTTEETKVKRRARLQRNYVAKHNRLRAKTHKSSRDYRRQQKHRTNASVTDYGL